MEAVGIRPIAHVIGTDEDIQWLESSMPVDILGHSRNMTDYETPTLQMLWEWCAVNPQGAVLYLHTKGVSAPHDRNKTAWRKLMMHYVVSKVENNLRTLEVADIVGVDWQNDRRYPHFSGNFWMARADWINSLKSPQAYRDQGGPVYAGHPWARMHAELWLGSAPYHHVESLCCTDTVLWHGSRVFELLQAVERGA